MKGMAYPIEILSVRKNLYPPSHANPNLSSKKFSIQFNNNISIEYAKALWPKNLKGFTGKLYRRFPIWTQPSCLRKKPIEVQQLVNVFIHILRWDLSEGFRWKLVSFWLSKRYIYKRLESVRKGRLQRYDEIFIVESLWWALEKEFKFTRLSNSSQYKTFKRVNWDDKGGQEITREKKRDYQPRNQRPMLSR